MTKGQVLGQHRPAPLRGRREAGAGRAERGRARTSRSPRWRSTRQRAELGRVEGLVDEGAGLHRRGGAGARRQRTPPRRGSPPRKQRCAQAAAVLDEAARQPVARRRCVSPIDGNVIELSREVGERVRGSDFSEDVVMTIAALNAMEVKIEVGEHEVVHLKPGQPAEVTRGRAGGAVLRGLGGGDCPEGAHQEPGHRGGGDHLPRHRGAGRAARRACCPA